MNGNCHFVYGATVGSMVALNLDTISSVINVVSNNQETATLFILGGLIGGVLPDIDNPKSHIGQLSKPISTIIGKINELLGKKGANHRGILHDPIVYIIGLVLSYFFIPSLYGLCIGCLSHLFLDVFNPKGIPFFLFKRVSLGKINSDSKGSIILTWICVILTIIIGCIIKFKL